MVVLSFAIFNSGASILIGLIGLYLVIKILIKWRNIDIDLIKARVFLNKDFLVMNWQYTFMSGASQAAHQFIDFISLTNYLPESQIFVQISGVLELMVIFFLVILAFEWYRVFYPSK